MPNAGVISSFPVFYTKTEASTTNPTSVQSNYQSMAGQRQIPAVQDLEPTFEKQNVASVTINFRQDAVCATLQVAKVAVGYLYTNEHQKAIAE